MKYYKKIIFTLILALLSSTAYTQVTTARLAGDWHATCAVEQTSDSSATFCGICPTIVHKDNNSLTIAGFNLNFGDEELKIMYAGSTSVIPFRFDRSKMRLTFEEKGTVYTFIILELEMLDKIILKSDDGNLLYLERRKKTATH